MLRHLSIALLLLAPAASAQTLIHARVDAADPQALNDLLSGQGYDVLEGSVTESSLDLIVSQEEFDGLVGSGLPLELIARGRPLNEIQAEDAVPAGYSDLQAIQDSLAQTAATYPDIAMFVDLTTTYGMPATVEGRHLFALKISDNVTQEEDEPTSLLVSAHHCREIVTPVIAMYGIDQLTSLYGTDPAITAAVDENEIWVAPIWNVDGYNWVFVGDNLWRKNRHVFLGGIGVDLNRNYPFGWSGGCAGSTSISSQTYKGPGAASEVETQTMMAFANDRRFSRVIDLHSSGEEVLYGYLCASSPLTNYWRDLASQLSTNSGYAGSIRPPSAEGEHYQWEITRGALGFLIETHTVFQPSFASATAEAQQVWPGVFTLFTDPIPVTGHVRDTCTGDGVSAQLTLSGIPFPNGETISSGGPFARYDAFLPPSTPTLLFDAPGFATSVVPTAIVGGSSTTEEVALDADVQLATVGAPQIGTSVQFQFDSVSDAGRVYVGLMSVSGTSPGIPLNNCDIPLVFDVTTLIPTKAPAVFNGFVGFLDGSGSATGTFNIPGDPTLVGIDVDFAYFTIDVGSGLGIHASNAAHLLLQS